MSNTISKYNPDNISPQAVPNQEQFEDLRLLSINQKESAEVYNDLALLSKRKARAILKIGNDCLNALIRNGDIKVILIKNREKIPFVSIQEYVYKMREYIEPEIESYEYIDEEESVEKANSIIFKINKGGM